jgi:hypothetical protein
MKKPIPYQDTSYRCANSGKARTIYRYIFHQNQPRYPARNKFSAGLLINSELQAACGPPEVSLRGSFSQAGTQMK